MAPLLSSFARAEAVTRKPAAVSAQKVQVYVMSSVSSYTRVIRAQSEQNDSGRK